MERWQEKRWKPMPRKTALGKIEPLMLEMLYLGVVGGMRSYIAHEMDYGVFLELAHEKNMPS